jgi:hypothetical protein
MDNVNFLSKQAAAKGEKKTDVIERPKALNHVGLLRNRPPG